MWRRVYIVLTDVSEERIASNFREEEISLSHLLTLVPRLRLSLLFSSTLKMEAIRSSEKSVNTISTRGHIPEDGFLHSHRRWFKTCPRQMGGRTTTKQPHVSCVSVRLWPVRDCVTWVNALLNQVTTLTSLCPGSCAGLLREP
jgi:hypothetical protein